MKQKSFISILLGCISLFFLVTEGIAQQKKPGIFPIAPQQMQQEEKTSVTSAMPNNVVIQAGGKDSKITLTGSNLDKVTRSEALLNNLPASDVESRLGPTFGATRQVRFKAQSSATPGFYQLRLTAGSESIILPINVVRLEVKANSVENPAAAKPGMLPFAPPVVSTEEPANKGVGKTPGNNLRPGAPGIAFPGISNPGIETSEKLDDIGGVEGAAGKLGDKGVNSDPRTGNKITGPSGIGGLLPGTDQLKNSGVPKVDGSGSGFPGSDRLGTGLPGVQSRGKSDPKSGIGLSGGGKSTANPKEAEFSSKAGRKSVGDSRLMQENSQTTNQQPGEVTVVSTAEDKEKSDGSQEISSSQTTTTKDTTFTDTMKQTTNPDGSATFDQSIRETKSDGSSRSETVHTQYDSSGKKTSETRTTQETTKFTPVSTPNPEGSRAECDAACQERSKSSIQGKAMEVKAGGGGITDPDSEFGRGGPKEGVLTNDINQRLAPKILTDGESNQGGGGSSSAKNIDVQGKIINPGSGEVGSARVSGFPNPQVRPDTGAPSGGEEGTPGKGGTPSDKR
jgi:hypothetical protein